MIGMPIHRDVIAELHAEPALWHLQDYRNIDATVQCLIEALNEAHAYGYRMESERNVADDARWKAEHGDPS